MDNYDGEITCRKCNARLAIKFLNSQKPVKYKLVKDGEPTPIKTIVKYYSDKEKA